MQKKIAKSFPSSEYTYIATRISRLTSSTRTSFLPSTTFFRISLPSIFPYNLITSTFFFFFENEFQTILPRVVFKTRKEKKKKEAKSSRYKFSIEIEFQTKSIDKRYIYIYGIGWSLRRFLFLSCVFRVVHSYIISVHTFVTLLRNWDLDDASFLRFYGAAEKMKKGGSY